MKIACVFPAHRRPHITLETIRMLKRQTIKPHVIMVGDSHIEAEVAAEAGCEYVQYPNRPLTSKWQAGVWRARDYNPDAMLIMGSDHWFTPGWCETYLGYLDRFDVVGCSGWHILLLEQHGMRIIHRSYKGPRSIEPAGMGRMYSRKAMQKMDWVLYKERRNDRADGAAMRRAKSVGCKIYAVNPPGAIAVTLKCPRWPMLHSWDDIIRDNRNLVKYPDVENPNAWLRDNFPGSLEAIKRLRKQVWQK